MRDDESGGWSILTILALVCAGWVLVKGSIIGYYDDELVPQLVLPAVAAIVLFWLDRRRSSRSHD